MSGCSHFTPTHLSSLFLYSAPAAGTAHLIMRELLIYHKSQFLQTFLLLCVPGCKSGSAFLSERDRTDKVEVETLAAVPGKLFLANK